MNDLLENIVNEALHPARADALLEIAKSISVVGYEEKLNDAVTIAAKHDSSLDAIGEIESLIFRSAFELLDRLGIDVDRDVAYNRPIHLSHIIDALLFDIEDWDDYDTLLAIVDSDEPEEITLGNIVSFITGQPASYYHEILHSVTRNILKVIRGSLSIKAIKDSTAADNLNREKVERVIKFMQTYPGNQLCQLFDNYGFLDSIEKLASKIELSFDQLKPDNYIQDLGTTAAGLAITKYDTYQAAYESDIGSIVKLIIDDERNRYLIAGIRAANNILQQLYTESEDNRE